LLEYRLIPSAVCTGKRIQHFTSDKPGNTWRLKNRCWM